MAADAVELATAYLSLVPSMAGAQNTLLKELLPGVESAAESAGRSAGGMFSSTMAKVLAGGAIVTAGVVAGFKGLYDVGGIFDDVSDTIRAGTGKSGEALDSLTDSAKRIGSTVPASFENIGTTVSEVSQRLNLSGSTLETVASQYLEAGRVLGQEVDIAGTSAALSAFKIEGEGVTKGLDTLFQVSQSTGVGMNELAASVQKNAPAMQTLGFSFEETAALAGTLDKAGLNSTAMMSAMGKGMVTLAKAGEEPEAAFKRVTGEISGFVSKGDKAAALNLAAKVFGTKGAAQFVGALESGTVALDDLVGGAKLSGDSILGLGKETADAAESWELLKNKGLLALEPLGTAVFNFAGQGLGFLADNMDGVIVQVTDFAKGVEGVTNILVNGDFSGSPFGWEEDSWQVDFLFNLRDGLGQVGTAVSNAASFVRTDFVPALQGFGSWLVENQATVANWATGIAVLMIPLFVRIGVAAVTSAAAQVVAWATSGAGAVTTAATYVVASYTMIGRWVAMGAAAVASGATTVAIWALYAAEAIKGAAIYAAQSARVALAWVVMSGAAMANAVVMAAGWVVGVVVPAAAAVVSFLIGVASVVGGWIAMAAGAMVNAVIMAAAWFVALGPIGWVIAAVVGLIALVIANWDKVSKFTAEAWANVTKFVSEAWSNITRGVSEGVGKVLGFFRDLPGNIGGFFAGAGKWLLDAGGNILAGFLDGLKKGFEGVKDFVGGIGQWIADHKGPKAYDLALLVPAGGWIMSGLGSGIRAGIPDLKRDLRAVSSTIANGVSGGAVELSGSSYGLGDYGVAAGGGPVYVQNPFTGGYLLAQVDTRVGAGISDANADIGRRRAGVRG